MRLVFDCRYTRVGRHDGISRYTAGLVAAVARRHDLTMLISDHRQLEMLPDLPWELVPPPTSAREPLLALRVNRIRPDVVYSPMQTMGTLGRRYRVVLTMHDAIYYTHRTPPRDLPTAIRLLWRLYHLSWAPQRALLNRADAVVTVSETTERLMREHRLTRRPITVVRNAATLAGMAPPADGTRERVLVYMGSFMPYKNVETLVAGMRHLPDYELHLMSGISAADRARLTRVAPDARVVFHDGASDEEYATLLGRATALVTASRDEGFGIPLVEAMSLGTPVVVSDIPIFREIGGDAALYFEARNARSFADAVRSLEGSDQWQRRSAEALRQADLFSWERSADALLDLLLRVADDDERGTATT
ncbi:glycosyltransferase family 4 protein [Planctomonas psychrotolerans]|uniref:glycosyltransferase family 4 protein n=1 Tax=Planctomonas psychrotolerans TaxID=2528712 RepID=UPI00123B7BF3|nr:glycosyltransferase family 1 protein [Planctomonas psychrotolerans]